MTLLELARNTISLSRELEKAALRNLESLRVDWSVYLDLAMTQLDGLESVLSLLEKKAYKDCFAILRSVLEGTFFLKLMIYGKRFRETRFIKVSPKDSSDPENLRDKIVEQWKKEKKAGNPAFKNVVDGGINTQGKDLILITIEDEGLYPNPAKKEEEEIITRYYFAFEEYNPETRFIASLPTLRKADPYSELTKEKLREQRVLYHQYFYIDNIVKNLKLNDLLNDEQADRFKVHYNFLSTFVHTTKSGNFRRYQKQYPGNLPPGEVEQAYNELIPSYSCKLESLLLETIANYFTSINSAARLQKYLDQAERLKAAVDDFWFIYNNPTDFDRNASDGLKRLLAQRGHKTIPTETIYYRNPLLRLVRLRRHKQMPYKT